MKSKIISIILMITLSPAWLKAQEYKLAKSTGRLEINTGRVTVEGYSGNEIIFSLLESRGEKDKRAEGLRAVNSLGLDDNTGLGINVTEKDNVISVYQLARTKAPDIKIMVPKGVIVAFKHESQYGGDARFKNMENEIEVSTQYNNVSLENVTGPLTVKTIYGHVEVDFGPVIKNPISIVAVYKYIDVTIPQATKADVKLETSYGEIYVAPEFKIEVEQKGGMVHYSDKVRGKINGGGVNIDLNSSYGKIYVRKK